MFIELLEEPKTPLSKGVGSPFRRSGGIRAGSTNSPKTLQNNGVAACGIPPSRLFKATHLPLTREALRMTNRSKNICLSNGMLLPKSTFSIEAQSTEKSCHSEEGVSLTWESVPLNISIIWEFDIKQRFLGMRIATSLRSSQ